MNAADRVRGDLAGIPRAWERFWFEPRSVAPLVFVRIALGLVIAAWAATLLPDAAAFLGPDGVLPNVPEVRIRTGILHFWRTDTAATVVVATLIPAGIGVALGLFTRFSTVLSFVLLLSIGRRDPYMMNSGDALLRHATLLLATTPAGAALSMDRWLADRDGFWEVPRAAPWGLRLLQIQLTFVYLFSSFEKLRGDPWLEGTALADAWRITDLARFGVPLPIYDSLLLTNVLTFSTLVIEIALAVLLWNRRARPYVALAGVALHLGIELTMSVGFFSITAVSLYLTFVAPGTAERWVGSIRSVVTRPEQRSGRTTVSLDPGEVAGSPPGAVRDPSPGELRT